LFKLLLPVWRLLFGLIKFLGKWFFKIFILPTYRVYLKIKNKNKKNKSSGVNILNIFSNKNTVHFLILLAGAAIFINNLNTKTTLAEDMGRGSMIFELAKSDEFSDIKDETITLVPEAKKNTGETTPGQTKNESATSTPGSFSEISLTKTTQVTAEKGVMEDLLAQGGNYINSGALLKQSSPQTEGALPERFEIINYAVQSGETVALIAKKFGISVNTILWENKLTSSSLLRPGQNLIILPTTGVSYTVGKKDTLAAIAKKYGVDEGRILTLNQLASASEIKAGQKLAIPGGRPPVQPIAAKTVASVFSKTNAGSSSARRAGGLIWPTVATHITQYFGWRHTGLDIGTPVGRPIYAATDGIVEVSTGGWNGGYGNTILINNGNGMKTRYGHLSKLYVTKGQEVRQGEVIGTSGNTGRSTGPHLHFEVMINGSRTNPLSYL
jgi:murein DD-endopeptidase MepM/ murein hydrolase activator NlpD